MPMVEMVLCAGRLSVVTGELLNIGAARGAPGLQPLSQKLGCSAHELMLSWLLQIDDCIIPIAGATRVESVTSIARAAKDKFPLADEDIAQFLR